jgi:hypothetical protein
MAMEIANAATANQMGGPAALVCDARRFGLSVTGSCLGELFDGFDMKAG